ncbi:RNA-dependent RNA polymerase 1-like [Rhodamnia argentea]|uniref:RNA-dependent RNA polymerase n=1 Tax=Rhodamnia argentea TaxID=178133 RepID=A0ABM3HFR8_9MYRT|nr:RNA-dependent RNA polymerase 1-like [Rhodamnia argentea]XP_048135419.1 RNA-dependent RNA polymerase 1-like [Rhodamnia argentea]XP_048135420.1 RNA-dependent RNA polymerase 1-like [Rhodamnia argentea]
MGKTINVHGFPSLVTADTVRGFLEQRTGSGTVYAIKVRQDKRGVRAYAMVQFMEAEYAELIVSLSNRKDLWHGRSYLTARRVEHDIVQRPRTLLNSMEGIILHFGCQVSTTRFSTLWKGMNVSVNFGIGLRKFCFLLSYYNTEYKLELSYENIWQIELHRTRDHKRMYLVIQLYGAPRIRKKVVQHSENLLDSPVYNFFRDGSDDQWVRATDFTPSACIGQSSGVCLEITSECSLPDFHENFVNYKETNDIFSVEEGFPFSCGVDLVPIVGPPRGVDLPYEILFKINLLVQSGCLAGPCLDFLFYRMVDPQRIDMDIILYALDKLFHWKECCYEPSKWLIEQHKKYLTSQHSTKLTSQHSTKLSSIKLDAGLVYVHRVQITPCRVYFFGPEINVSNHVLRSYAEYIDNFIRISFVDEDLDKIHSTDLSPRTASRHGRTDIYERVLSVLKNGIRIGDKKFEFLAFSSSQLRENSAWMFAPINGCTAATIREKMGEFSQIRNVAKYASRLGQSLSSSTETLNVGRHEVEVIPDVEVKSYVENIHYVFSDGIGKISEELARKVARKCSFKSYTPSAFQIRYGGYKGVVAVDPTSYVKLSLRKSMAKYESNETKLNVLAWSKYQPCFLNRQLITLLSTLGVPDHVFEKMQKNAVDQLNAILVDPLRAQEALDLMSPGENSNILKEMLKCGYKPDAEPFLSMMLRTFRATKLFELRTKTRIFLPKGRSMMGCLDETGTLEYGQVFVQYSGKKGQMWDESIMFIGTDSDQSFVVRGKVVVAKNPCLHPGDVRVLTAIDVPALHHMVDCVVFPQKGKRPHPNECSGSDLDGDIYFVSWDSELVPHRQIQPMDYTPAPTERLDHDVTIEEVEEYFVNYILNDSLGIIANAHTVFADSKPEKAMSSECIELAKLFSIAVDFPKTGVPAVIPPNLYAKEYPDFMEKLDKPSYRSNNVIGKLFREVKDEAYASSSIRKFTQEMARQSYDPDMEVDGFEDYVDDAFYHKGNYDYKLGNLMEYYGIKTEAEILSGCIMKMSKSFTKKRDAESITMAVKSLRKEARTWFNDKGSGSHSEAADEYAKASAWYHVTYHLSYWGCYNEGLNRDHYLSFPWCVHDKLIQIKKERRDRTTARKSTLEDYFNRGLRLN